MKIKNRKIAVYLTGGIASYKAASFVRLLIKEGADVRVGMTNAAKNFITPLTLATLSRHPVISTFTDAERQKNFIPHIELAQWADASIIIPATANIIAKMANGIADDFVSSALIATDHDKCVVPAMNDKMWNNPAVQRNLRQLQMDGIQVLEPVNGFLAEGYSGKGRMPEPEEILEWLKNMSEQKDFRGTKILITAGGTEEPIDPVRFIGNRSSGKMGVALAQEAARRGADVTLIAGKITTNVPQNIHTIRVNTFSDLQAQLTFEFPKCDVLVMAAAVSDYHVENSTDCKIKADKHERVQLTLQKNPNLLRQLGHQKHHQILVGFAAETNQLLRNATEELSDKKVNMLVANDVSRSDIGFGSDQNAGYLLIPRQDPIKITKCSKQVFAQHILNQVITIMRKAKDGN